MVRSLNFTIALQYDEDLFLGSLQRLARRFDSISKANPRSEGWHQVLLDLLPVINEFVIKKRPQ